MLCFTVWCRTFHNLTSFTLCLYGVPSSGVPSSGVPSSGVPIKFIAGVLNTTDGAAGLCAQRPYCATYSIRDCCHYSVIYAVYDGFGGQ